MKPTIDLFRMMNNKPTQHELLADRKKVFVVKCYCRKTTLFEKKTDAVWLSQLRLLYSSQTSQLIIKDHAQK